MLLNNNTDTIMIDICLFCYIYCRCMHFSFHLDIIFLAGILMLLMNIIFSHTLILILVIS